MNFRKEVILDLQGAVEGEVKIVLSPLVLSVYHNGSKIKKTKGLKAKFLITTATGEVVPIFIRNGKGMVRTVHFKDQQIPLEEKLTSMEQLLSIGSIAAVYIVGCVLFGFMGGIIGGMLIGGTIGLGATLNFAFIRQEKSMMLKVLVSFGIAGVAFFTYYIFCVIFASLFFISFY